MSRRGYGFGAARRQPVRGNGPAQAQSLSQAGVSFTFAAPRPTGQYANGNWWVLGPATVAAMSPGSQVQPIFTDGNGATVTDRVINGAMVNPGNRSFATGGLTANNTTNTVQGWDSIAAGGKPRAIYSAAANVDPGATGAPLSVTTGSIVKFASKLTGLPADNRPAGLDMAVLTVVDTIPAGDAILPGVSRSNKASPCRLSHFNLGVFQNLPPTANAPSYAQALDWLDRYIETSQPDSINNPVAKAINNHPEYGRDIANNLHRALLCLHLSSFTAEQKLALLAHLGAIADDLVSRAEEGAITLAAGGGIDVALDRFTGDARPRSPYTNHMIGSAEWGEGEGTGQLERNGSNWNAYYRTIVGNSLIGGTLAVELTTGAKALWDFPELWRYMDTVYLRRAEDDPGNNVPVFVMEMLNTYRPAKVAPPALLESGVRGADLWLRYDQALNEITNVPVTSAFTVMVNGIARAVTAVVIWRQNIGLTLASETIGGDMITVGYTPPGTSPARSVDGINVPALTGLVCGNRNELTNNTNTAFPVVRFVAGAKPRILSPIGGTTNATIATANSAFGTFALLKFKFATLPAIDSEIFGNSAGALPFRLFLLASGRMELRLNNAAGVIVARAQTPLLTANTEYDLLWSWDLTQTTSGVGINCYANGTAQALNVVAWGGGAGVVVGYAATAAAAYTFNFTGNLTWEMGAFWLDATSRLDITSNAERAKFTGATAGVLTIASDGSGITGTMPTQFLTGSASQWNDTFGIQRGTGRRFFNTSTPLVAVSGADWGSFTETAIFSAGEQGYWIDPSDLATMFQDAAGSIPVTAVGQSVGRILDKSGRGNHFHQPDNAVRPVLQQDSGGNRYLFGGWMQSVTTINAGADKMQLVTGLRKTSDAALAMVTEMSVNGSSNSGFYFAAPENTGAAGNYTFFTRGAGVSVAAIASGTFLAPETAVITVTADIAGDSRVMRRNGVQVASSSADLGTGNLGSHTIFLLRRAGTALPFSGRLYGQVCRFGPNLTASTIAAIERRINARTGAF